jgi:hypothetical protein
MADADKNDFLLSWIVVCRSFPICLHRAFRAIIELPSSQSEGCAAAALDTDDRQDSGLLHRDPQSLSYNVSSLSRGGELWKEDAFSSVMVSYPAVVMSPFFFIPRRTASVRTGQRLAVIMLGSWNGKCTRSNRAFTDSVRRINNYTSIYKCIITKIDGQFRWRPLRSHSVTWQHLASIFSLWCLVCVSFLCHRRRGKVVFLFP